MEKDLMTIVMTPEEYQEYRNFQKIKEDLIALSKTKDREVLITRDLYFQEYQKRREIEQELSKLKAIMNMS